MSTLPPEDLVRRVSLINQNQNQNQERNAVYDPKRLTAVFFHAGFDDVDIDLRVVQGKLSAMVVAA